MKKISLVLVVMVVVAMSVSTTRAKDIVQMSEHGSLWRLAQECGHPGAAWTAIAVKNPWLKIKMVKGRPVAIVRPGQPIILPDGWIASEESDEEGDVQSALAGAIWADFCDMAKNYPMPTMLLLFIIVVVISARNVVDARRERRKASTEPNQRGRWESILLPR